MIHLHSIKVGIYGLVRYNHLNHSAYVQYFEVGRIELLESIGFSLTRLKELGCHLVVTQIEDALPTPGGAAR